MGTTPPTATSTIAMARSLPLLALLVTVTGVAGQISFGGGKEVKRQEMVVKEEKVVKVLLSKPKLQTVNFASNERKKKNPTGSDRVSLADLLEGEHQLPPRVSSRFAFGGSALGKVGQGCSTPSGQAGSCNYITAGQCRPVLETILKRGIDRAMLNYLIKAISFPCGFEDFDFTLCCADPNISTTTESTTATTTSSNTGTTTTTSTTTTTTTTGAPKISCGVVPPISNIVAPDAIRLLSVRGPAPGEKIVGGTLADVGAWPWAVLIGKKFSNGHFQVICGGTLIDDGNVLSAAHCFDKVKGLANADTVRVGETDLNIGGEGGGHRDIGIARVLQHPLWNKKTLAHDIAILDLASTVEFRPGVVPACMPDNNHGRNLTSLLANPSPTITGWGATFVGGGTVSRLREAQVPVVGEDECLARYRPVGVRLSEKQLCAGRGGTDTCQGDSGGGMVANNLDGRWTLVGVTSFGVDCARPDFPGVYTRVDQYLDWIRSNV